MTADALCASCKFPPEPNKTLIEGLCGFCWRYENGTFEVIDDAAIVFNFYESIVARAQLDAGIRTHPRYKMSKFCECGAYAQTCAMAYLRLVWEYAVNEGYDGGSIANLIGRIGQDSKTMIRVDPRVAYDNHRRATQEAARIAREGIDDMERLAS